MSADRSQQQEAEEDFVQALPRGFQGPADGRVMSLDVSSHWGYVGATLGLYRDKGMQLLFSCCMWCLEALAKDKINPFPRRLACISP